MRRHLQSQEQAVTELRKLQSLWPWTGSHIDLCCIFRIARASFEERFGRVLISVPICWFLSVMVNSYYADIYKSTLFRGYDFGFELRSQPNIPGERDQLFHDVELFKNTEKIV